MFDIQRRKRATFPPVSEADEDGLLMLGGQLSVDWLLEAYRRGIFPWPIHVDELTLLAWFSPDPRAILELDGLHVSRRLARRLRTGQFDVTVNRDFARVIAHCAAPRSAVDGVWITPEMVGAYQRLHDLGLAHSIEVWRGGRLAGGLYGVALGGLFSAESMFHQQRDASKVALVHLVERLRQRGFALLDIQQSSPHMLRMGAIEISRDEYLRRLRQALPLKVAFDS